MARTTRNMRSLPFCPILVGTKCDDVVGKHGSMSRVLIILQDNRSDVDEADRLARLWGIPHIVTSAADDFCVQGAQLPVHLKSIQHEWALHQQQYTPLIAWHHRRGPGHAACAP